MGKAKPLRTLGIVIMAGLVGSLIFPPVVRAATSLVTIQGAGSTNKAKVTAGRLLVDTEAITVNRSLSTVPGAIGLLKQGSATTTGPGPGVVTAAVLDVPAAAVGQVKVVITSATTFVWQGSAGPGEHLGDTFGGGMFYEGSLQITVTGTGGRFAVYGYTF